MAEELDPGQFDELNPDDFEEVGAESNRVETPPPPPPPDQGTDSPDQGPQSPSFWQRAGAQADAFARAFNRMATAGLSDPLVAAGRWAAGGFSEPYGDLFLRQEAEGNIARQAFPKTTLAGAVAGAVPMGAAATRAVLSPGVLPTGWAPATIGPKAGIMPIGTATAVGAATGALQGAADADPQFASTPIIEAAKGGTIGGGVSGGMSALLGRYAATSPVRLVEQTRDDVVKGASPTAAKRFSKASEMVSDAINERQDAIKFRNRIRNPRELEEVISEIDDKIDDAASVLPKAYEAWDNAQPFSAAEVYAPVVKELARIERKGGEQAWRSVLETVKQDLDDRLVGPYVKDAGGNVSLKTVAIPSADVRSWVTKLLKTVNQTMGSLAETERMKLREDVYKLADEVYFSKLQSLGKTAKGPSESAAAYAARMARDTAIADTLRPANRTLRALLTLRAPLTDRLDKYKAGKYKGLAESAIEYGKRTAGYIGVPSSAAYLLSQPEQIPAIAAGTGLVLGGAAAASMANRAMTLRMARLAAEAMRGNYDAQVELLRMTGRIPVQAGAAGGAVSSESSRAPSE